MERTNSTQYATARRIFIKNVSILTKTKQPKCIKICENEQCGNELICKVTCTKFKIQKPQATDAVQKSEVVQYQNN